MVRKLFKKTGISPGTAPGTLIHVGEKKTEKIEISLINYNEERFIEKEINSVEECFQFQDENSVTWININGLHDIAVMQKIGDKFNLHSLILEDILNTQQRPKYEDFNDYIFVVMKMIYYDSYGELNAEQVSVVLGKNFVISFQEKPGDVFEPVRQRIRTDKSKIRKMKSDYLMYALIDAIVDSYFIILENLAEKIENLEEDLLKNPTPEISRSIHNFKRDAIFLRKSVWPLREIISSFQRLESKFITKNTAVYFRDIYDHTIQIIDNVETLRDIISGMLDVYLSSLSNKMNEVMKVLTIIATIFIPLTFIVGIYGMNFKYMPELEYVWAYPVILLLMVIMAFLMLCYFKKKKWL